MGCTGMPTSMQDNHAENATMPTMQIMTASTISNQQRTCKPMYATGRLTEAGNHTNTCCMKCQALQTGGSMQVGR